MALLVSRGLRRQLWCLLKKLQWLQMNAVRMAPTGIELPKYTSRCLYTTGSLKYSIHSHSETPSHSSNESSPSNSETGDHKNKMQSLDYDLDKLLANIQTAREKGSAQPYEQIVETDRHRSPMNIEGVVEFFREERGQGVCVIRVPPEREYVKYFVTCTGLSSRHIQSMASSLMCECKGVSDANDRRCHVRIEGKDSEDWVVIDLGDIVVHLMTEEARQLYQLEQLWTLGHRYDDQYQRMERINQESDALK